MNQEAYDKMLADERTYLLANSWTQRENSDYWSHLHPTDPYRDRQYLRQGHAVNCQKQWDRMDLESEAMGPSGPAADPFESAAMPELPDLP